jgi:hypothetical protein
MIDKGRNRACRTNQRMEGNSQAGASLSRRVYPFTVRWQWSRHHASFDANRLGVEIRISGILQRWQIPDYRR